MSKVEVREKKADAIIARMFEALAAVDEALSNGDLVGNPATMLPNTIGFRKHVELITKVHAALAIAKAEGRPE